MRTLAVSVTLVVAVLLVVMLGGAIRWRLGDRDLVRALERAVAAPGVVGADQRASSPAASREARVPWTPPPDLPAPVARYLSLALGQELPVFRRARFLQRGSFLLRPGRADGWAPFTAEQWMTRAPAGFVWLARIRVAPALSAGVRDGFVAGQGAMQASLLGLVPLADTRGTPEIAAAALHRYLAEAAWMPLVLLPSEPDQAAGVSWTAVDASSARVTLTAYGTTVSLDVGFGEDGMIASVYAPDRLRDVDGRGVPTPWLGKFWNYEERAGMRIPLAGEVAWILPDGPQPYWRGEVLDASYE
jgi:hypothetical protein